MKDLLTNLGFAASLLLIGAGIFSGFALMGVVYVADKASELIDHRP